MKIHFKETSYGFEYGGCKITRIHSDEKRGWIVLGLLTKKYPNCIDIYVTKTGKVRIHDKNGEWKKPNLPARDNKEKK